MSSTGSPLPRGQPLTFQLMAESFAQTLKRIRQQRKISQQELAELIGVHVRQISKYEMGVCLPTLERIRRMSEVLEVSADELVFGSSSRKKSSNPDPTVRHPILAERLHRLEALVSRDDLKSIIDFLDAFIAKKKIDQIASGHG